MPKLSPPRVAISGVSGDMGQGCIQGARAEKVWLLGLDGSADNVGYVLCDAHQQLPMVADPSYIEALIATLRQHDIDVFFPCLDSEILLIATERDRIESEAGCRVSVSDVALVQACSDKLNTHHWFNSLGLDSPETLVGDTPVKQIEAALGYPAIVKPRSGRGSVGVALVQDREQLLIALGEEAPAMVVQTWIDGPEYTVGLLYDDDGHLIDHLSMQRWLHQGRTIRAEVSTTPGIEALMEQLATLTGARGALNLQLRVDPTGRALPFEVNPRLSGSTNMRVAIGFNDPNRLIRYFARGEPMRRADVLPAKVYRRWTEEIVPYAH